MNVLFHKQTLARAYSELITEVEGALRVALGDFTNDFFKYYEHDRQSLLDEPIEVPENPTEDQRGWAAFCAAAAEYLAGRYGLVCPTWALDPARTLTEPWYHPSCKTFPGLRASAEKTAPDAFRKRNVFCTDRVFSNPYPSSREPGSLADRRQRRMDLLGKLPAEEREAYLAEFRAQMKGKPRVHIVV